MAAVVNLPALGLGVLAFERAAFEAALVAGMAFSRRPVAQSATKETVAPHCFASAKRTVGWSAVADVWAATCRATFAETRRPLV